MVQWWDFTPLPLSQRFDTCKSPINCELSDMSVSNLIKGLAQSGACGCLEEFNTIRIEMLSVVAKQLLIEEIKL